MWPETFGLAPLSLDLIFIVNSYLNCPDILDRLKFNKPTFNGWIKLFSNTLDLRSNYD